MPTNLLDLPTSALLEAFRMCSIEARNPSMLADFPLAACEERLQADWRNVAIRIWTNWLSEIRARRIADSVSPVQRTHVWADPYVLQAR